MNTVAPLTTNFLNMCYTELRKKENRQKISKNIINPLVREIMIKLSPFLFFYLLIQILVVLILIYKVKIF